MKITRNRLSEIIREEIEAVLEADGPKRKRKSPGDHEVTSADQEPVRSDDTVPDGGTVKTPSADPVPPGRNSARGGPDPSKLNGPDGDSLEDEPEEETDDPDDGEALDKHGDAGEDPSGAVNNEVSGKTIQAITVEEKSKVLPGAKEVVVAFNEGTDALRILVTPTGKVCFFWRGQLHDLP